MDDGLIDEIYIVFRLLSVFLLLREEEEDKKHCLLLFRFVSTDSIEFFGISKQKSHCLFIIIIIFQLKLNIKLFLHIDVLMIIIIIFVRESKTNNKVNKYLFRFLKRKINTNRLLFFLFPFYYFHCLLPKDPVASFAVEEEDIKILSINASSRNELISSDDNFFLLLLFSKPLSTPPSA